MDFQSKKSFRKLRLRAIQPYHQMLYISTLSTLGIRISNAFNAIYVDTVDTNDMFELSVPNLYSLIYLAVK